MSVAQIPASGATGERWNRIKGLPAALWSHLIRPWTRSPEKSLAKSTPEIFHIKDRSNLDQIAVEVFQLLQAVPDDCEAPQALVLNLAQQVQERRDEGAQRHAAASSANAAATEQSLKEAFNQLDPEARAILRLQLWEESHYRAIAERLKLPPALVLRILTDAYAQLRWHTETVRSTTQSIPP
jgi:DNA-directed RNA polymerase specialized sigma24 family protein